MKKKVTLLLLLFLACGAAAAFLLLKRWSDWRNTVKLDYTATDCPETNAYLYNPYEGFYHIYGYVLKDNFTYPTLDDVPNVEFPEDSEITERLAQIQINLRNFPDRPLSDSALEQLDMILAAWRQTKDYTLLLRFLYDWDGRALETEPETLDLIMQHMEQAAGVYNRYSDIIFTLQGISTGNNGEMHHTNFSAEEDTRRLGEKLASVSDPSIYLAVRTPAQWRCVTGVDSYDELAALSGNPYLGRLGLFNDGMLGSGSDMGTYIERSREEELSFQDILCRAVPNGGEVIVDNPCNDLDNAIQDMRAMHISYLNSCHDLAVLDKWRETTYHGNNVFDGVSGYDYIRNHLGYRYVLRETQVEASPDGRAANLRISIENVGFAASYRNFSFLLTLANRESGERFSLIPEQDSGCLAAGETTALSVPLDTADYPSGTYDLYWQTSDGISGENILYGNDLSPTEYGYALGTLTISNPRDIPEGKPRIRAFIRELQDSAVF